MKCFTHSAIIFLTLTFEIVVGGAQSRSYIDNDEDDDQVQSYVINPSDNDTDFGPMLPNRGDRVYSKVLNINDSSASSLLSNFNLTRDYVMHRLNQSGRIYRQSDDQNNYQENIENGDGGNNDHSFQIEMAKTSIRQRIESAVHRNTSQVQPDPDAVINQIAFYPVCSKNDENSWLAENTAKLYFTSSIFNKLEPSIILHKAELRLYQKNPENVPEIDECTSDVDELIRVTISVMAKREIQGETKYKKTLCNSFTTSKRKTGWVAVDIEQVIRRWEKAYRSNSSNSRAHISDPMLMIDVEDEEKNQLKAGLYFESTECQAAPAFPWGFYGEIRDSSGRIQMQHAPKYPRIDFEYSRLTKTTNQYSHPPLYRHYRVRNRYDNLRHLRDTQQIDSQQQQHQQQHHNYHHQTEDQKVHRKRHIHHKHQSSRDDGFSMEK